MGISIMEQNAERSLMLLADAWSSHEYRSTADLIY